MNGPRDPAGTSLGDPGPGRRAPECDFGKPDYFICWAGRPARTSMAAQPVERWTENLAPAVRFPPKPSFGVQLYSRVV